MPSEVLAASPDFAHSDAIVWKYSRNALATRCGITVGHRVLNAGSQGSLVVCSHVGVGSLGLVEDVRSSSPGFETFVRKRVQLPYYQRKKSLQIIQEEAKALEDLCHPHIVQILGSYEDFTQRKLEFYCLFMSPVGENDLKTFMDRMGELEPNPKRFAGSAPGFPA
jgi:serine/threonine protein kinase